MERLPDWFGQGNCNTVDVNLMYPEAGDELAEQAAKVICIDCPVEALCLGWALNQKEREGVWGGQTPAERHHLSRALRRESRARRNAR